MESDPLNVELELLREFHTRWVEFHAIPRDKLHRNQLLAASQNLVEASNAIKAFDKPCTLLRVVN